MSVRLDDVQKDIDLAQVRVPAAIVLVIVFYTSAAAPTFIPMWAIGGIISTALPSLYTRKYRKSTFRVAIEVKVHKPSIDHRLIEKIDALARAERKPASRWINARYTLTHGDVVRVMDVKATD